MIKDHPAAPKRNAKLRTGAAAGQSAVAATGYAITNGFGTYFCTVTPPVGNLFFRLRTP